ncbi:alpha-2-glucosyltransferase Alg10, partial [Sporodiniella umbellata]
DEIFHVPQAQQYCQGNYSDWDPKLTTPPGLYIVSNIIEFLGRGVGFSDLCTLNALRTTNILFSIGLYFVLCGFFRNNKLYALTLASFPVGYFYNFLYYTDSGSTFFVLLSYLLLVKKRYHLSGFIGFISLTFRQTNVVWVCLFMVLVIIDILSSKGLVNPPSNSIKNIGHSVESITSLVCKTFTNLYQIIPSIVTYLLTIISFVAFLIWNNGIVLGDKSNHLAGLHFPQMFYFTSFLSFFSVPLNFSYIVRSIFQPNAKLYMCSAHLISRYEHPFLLADNRHYSFYIWRKIYRRHWVVRYLLIPFYVVSGYFNLQRLRTKTFLFNFGYIATLVLTLVPSPLLEFRYFIIPFLFYMIHTPPKSKKNTWLAFAFYMCLNIATIYLFIYKPFKWPSEPEELQRFIW